MARAYLVCSTPRSGSTLLGAGLRATGHAGAPQEYFNPARRAALAAEWGCGASVGSYLQAVLARRTGDNGVFGLKLQWHQLVSLRAEVLDLPAGEPGFDVDAGFLEALLPGLRYVHIVRRDVDRQAVSLWVAGRTDEWHRAPGESARPSLAPYSFKGIAHCRTFIANCELHWDRFFRFNRIDPVIVEYEQLVADYQSTIRRVTAELVPDAGDVAVADPSSARQADERSEELLERFRRELESRPAYRRAAWRAPAARIARRLRSLTGALP